MVHASGHAFTQNHCPFNLGLLTDGKLFGGCSNSKKNNVGVLSGFAWRSPGSLFLIIRRCV